VMQGKKKAVSTLIASMFVIFLIVAMVSSLILIMNYWRTVTTHSLEKIELASQKTMESLRVIQGPTLTHTKIEIIVENEGSTYILLQKYYVRDLQTNQVQHGDLNEYIPVSSKATITIYGTFDPSHNYTIILISSRYNRYVTHYPPPPPPTPPTRNVTYSIIYAPEVFSNYTVAVKGYNASMLPPKPPSGYTVPEGNVVSGNISSLNESDGNYLVLNPVKSTTYEFPSYSSWKYYREINITETTGSDLNQYTVKLTLGSNNFTFSHANSDGSDVIFLDSSGKNVLNFWIQEWSSSSGKAIIWIKIPHLPGGGKTSIYMLYGNPSYNNKGKPFYGLTKVMQTYPASDGSNYKIYYEVWDTGKNLFDSHQGVNTGWYGDDSTWRYTLPFTFHFYNEPSSSYSSIYVCSNGFIGTTYRGSDYYSTVNKLKDRGMIAPFWADLRILRTDGYGIFINRSYSDAFGQGVYIRWKTRFYYWNGQQNFAAILYKNGLIRFDYGRIYGWSYTDDTPVIGVSLGDGSHYTLITKNNNERASNWNYHSSIILWPRKKASSEPELTLSGERSNAQTVYSLSIILGWSGMTPANIAEFYLNAVMSNAAFKVSIMENSTGSWRMIYSGANGIPSRVGVYKYFKEGSVGLMLSISSSNDFTLKIDYAGVNARSVDIDAPLLAVAENGSNHILIFDPTKDSWTRVNLSGSLINPSLAYDYLNATFLILNYSEILVYDPYLSSLSTSPVRLSIPAGDSAIILAIYNGSDYLFYAPGSGRSEAYIYSLTNGSLINSSNLPLPVGSYTCSAYSNNLSAGYLMFGGSGKVFKISLMENGNPSYEEMYLHPGSPTVYPVGLDTGDGKLWVIEKGGGLHSIDLVTGDVTPLYPQPPYTPLSEGDRLAFIVLAGNEYLLHIKEDGSSDLWIIKIGGSS